MGLANRDCKGVGGGGCAGAGAAASARNTFKLFKCIIEKWSDTLGKLTELASVIGRSLPESAFVPPPVGFPQNEHRHEHGNLPCDCNLERDVLTPSILRLVEQLLIGGHRNDLRNSIQLIQVQELTVPRPPGEWVCFPASLPL